MLVAHDCKRRVYSHRSGRFNSVLRHRKNHLVHIFVVPAERTVHYVALFLRVDRNFLVRNHKILQLQKVHVQPFAVRIKVYVLFFRLFVGNKTLLDCVNKKNFSGLKT